MPTQNVVCIADVDVEERVEDSLVNHNLSQVRAKISKQNFGEVFKIEIWSTCDLTEKPLLRALNSWVCCAFGNYFTNSSELCTSYQTKISWRRFDIDGMVRRRCTRVALYPTRGCP